MIDLIHKKKHNQELSEAEIKFFVENYTSGNIPDYQVSAFAMAIYFQGMSDQETTTLTQSMVDSGDTIDLSDIEGIVVDKHSTGGVGDKVSLIITPLIASLGIPVAKMSGRGLGHTGGTIDKLEAIDGFKIELTREEFTNNANEYKVALAGQSGNLVPADKKLYALRDVTDTVDSLPLIASSIMSKKIASGSDAIVLDVKVGSGAFMKTVEEATALAEIMTSIGNNLGRKTVAVLTNMNQPLGREIGNANEVREAVEVLSGKGEQDITEVSMVIASHMAVLGGAYSNEEEARKALDAKIASGEALEKFKQFVEIQGGNFDSIYEKQASHVVEVKAKEDGALVSVDSEQIGLAAMKLGAGRSTKEDEIDYSVGISMHHKIGARVTKNDTLFTLYMNDSSLQADVEETLHNSYRISETYEGEYEYVYKIIK